MLFPKQIHSDYSWLPSWCNMFGNGFQDYLSHCFHRDWREAILFHGIWQTLIYLSSLFEANSSLHKNSLIERTAFRQNLHPTFSLSIAFLKESTISSWRETRCTNLTTMTGSVIKLQTFSSKNTTTFLN